MSASLHDRGPADVAMAAKSLPKPVGAVVHAIRLLRVLAERGEPMTLTAAARAAEVNPSTAYHILRTLAHEGLAAFEPETKRYGLGLGLLSLARGLMGHRAIDLLRPELVRLATAHDCLLALWQIVDERVVLVDRALADAPVRLDMRVTQRMPLLLGAIGRAYAAAAGLEEARLREGFRGLRWYRPPSFETYLEQIRLAKRRGYGVDRDTLYQGIIAIGAVVADEAGQPALGISAIALSERVSAESEAAIGRELVRLSGVARGARPLPL